MIKFNIPTDILTLLNDDNSSFWNEVYDGLDLTSNGRKQQCFRTYNQRLVCLINSLLHNRKWNIRIHHKTYSRLFSYDYTVFLNALINAGIIDRNMNPKTGYVSTAHVRYAKWKTDSKYAHLSQSQLNSIPLSKDDMKSVYSKEVDIAPKWTAESVEVKEYFMDPAEYKSQYLNKLYKPAMYDVSAYVEGLTGLTLSKDLTDQTVKDMIQNCTDKEAEVIVHAVNAMRSGNIEAFVKQVGQRVYNGITSMKSVLRKYITNSDGDQFVEADIKACQLAALPWLFSKSNFNSIKDSNTSALINSIEKGTQYELILDVVSKTVSKHKEYLSSHLNASRVSTRDEIKDLFMRFINSDPIQIQHYKGNYAKYKHFDAIMKREFPSLYKFRAYIRTEEYINHFYSEAEKKIHNMSPKNHWHFTYTIVENVIVKETVKEFVSRGIDIYSVHDCVGVPVKYKNAAVVLMKHFAKVEFGLDINVE